MPTEFQNATGHPIWLPGPDGQKVSFNRFERKPLDDWFKRYVPRYLRMVITAPVKATTMQPPQNTQNRGVIVQPIQRVSRPTIVQAVAGFPQQMVQQGQRIPGRTGMANVQATTYLNQLVQKTSISISNDIGIGILSYNRLISLRRLVDSLRRHTDLLKVTVFISDESTDPQVIEYLKTIQDMCVLMNTERLGVAGNSNRLLRCLQRFRYKFLLNDDVEILSPGWENLYIKSSVTTGIHHFCMRQPGVYGATATEGALTAINGIKVQTITEKPHGAMMFFDHQAATTVGYFDEEMFGLYGMEHVDWSNRVSLSKIQTPGFHDVVGSTAFIKIHHEKSAVAERHLYSAAKKKYQEVRSNFDRVYIKPSDKSDVPSISYVIPFRGTDRKDCIKTVLQNIKAQRFPHIEIIMAEQDNQNIVKMPEYESIIYVLAQTPPGQAFTKAVAFNVGVTKVTTDKIILHDADMIVYDGYTSEMFKLLDQYEGAHVGKSVLYLSKESTDLVNSQGKLTNPQAERSVQYFEGGSLGCTRKKYINIGGFNENFVGYGVEDCEFFERLKFQNFFDVRSVDLVHLWHGRSSDWTQHHHRNKQIGNSLRMKPMGERINTLVLYLQKKYDLKP